jgi:hypothetical protein
MPDKIEALGILLILLPGFSCAYVTQHLAVRRDQTELDKAVEALLFSFVLYLATLPFFGYTLPVSWHAIAGGSYQIVPSYPHLLTLFVSSILLGVLYAANINHDWVLGVLRKINVTERTARSSIWNDAFQEIGGYVQVGMRDGRKLLGWVRYYSDESSDCSIFLEDAAWIGDNGEVQSIDGPGVLLTKECGVEFVMFLDWSTSDEKTSASSPAN